uniref:Tectonin beta-propeller repeat containing 2 n=1 Tax=Anolis carolinensis TaxID=28377 RepID=A0A803TA95_ANOCA
MASETPSSSFKEFCPLYYLLNAIPTKIQKGFRSIVVYLTALDTNGNYIAVGSSIGMLYLYCRHFNQMKKYNFEGKNETITVVKLLSCFDDLVAVGTASGKIAIFQLVSSLPGRNKQLRRFNVSGFHKSSITALAWSPNGMKLFSGDDKGKIVYSALDLDKGLCTSTLVLEEPCSIVQLDYSQKVLLVSTLQRSLLFYTEEKSVKQVGAQPRKNTGKFGACFIPGLCKRSDLTLFAGRPGIRLWKSDVHGTVQATFILKDVFAAGMKPFELYPRVEPLNKNSYNFPERQIGLISCFFQEGWVLSWNEYSIYLLDTVNQTMIGSLEGSGDIVSVSCTENEIFLLKGDRDIIRISSRPEGLMSTGFFDELGDLSTNPRRRGYSVASESRSRSSSMNSSSSFLTGEDQTSEVQREGQLSSQRFSLISSEDFNQELIVKAIKVKKKKRRPANGAKRHPSSLESTPCYEDQGFSDSSSFLNADSFSINSSLMGSITDRLSVSSVDQESIFSSESQNVLREENGSETFSVLQSPRSMAALSPEDNGAVQLLKLSNNESALGTLSTMDFSTSDPSLLLPEDKLGSEDTECKQKQQQPLEDTIPPVLSKKEVCPQENVFWGEFQAMPNTHTARKWISDTCDVRAEKSASSDEEDIYGHGLSYSSSEASVAEIGACLPLQDKIRTHMEEGVLLKSDQFAESWMGYAGPGYGILSLVVSDKYIWCLDYKGGLYCSALPSAGLRWQRFEDNVQQVAVSPSGALLWKIEQKTSKAFACGKVTIKGKRHWYEALPQTAFVSLSDDTAWIIRTNGDLYLQTGLSVDRPCARAVKVDCPYPLSQVAARNNVVWALTEQRALLFREGVSGFCPEGEQWKCDIISEMQALEPMCVTLGDQQTIWILDIHGNLWFRTGVASKKPQGDDNHWWQVSITDYVVFDQSSLFQTILQATQTVATAAQAPVEKVADKLRMAFWSQPLQCQPSLLAVNSSGVWISSGKNEFHVAKGSLIGTYWNNVVPRGTASATKWAFVLASASPTKEGSFLWLCQSSKDLFCVGDQNPQFHPSTVQLPTDSEIVYYSACQDAIWSLDSLGQVFIRTLSPNCPSGMHWTKLDLSQLGAVKLRSLACGNQHIWACDRSGGIYFRVGTQPLNPSLMLPAWIMIEPPIQSRGFTLSKRVLLMSLALGLQACELAISIRTVWARCPNGDIARRYGITDKNPAGDYWKKIPGNVSCLTVTPQDELWAVGPSGNLLQRLTKTFHHSRPLQKHGSASMSFHSDDFEDEWEVI